MIKLWGKVKKYVSALKIRLILTYIIIIILSVSVLRTYIISVMSENLFADNKISMMEKINIIAMDIAKAPKEKTAEIMGEDIIRLGIGNDSRLIVVDTEGIVFYDNAINVYADSTGKVRLSPMVVGALSGSSSYNRVELSDEISTAAAVPVMKDGKVSGVVYIEASANEIGIILDNTKRSITYLAAFLCALATLLSFIFAGIITSPIEKLTKKVRAISADRKEKIDIEASGEIGELVESFNNLIDELDEQEKKRTEFVSNASHELKTPLSSIKLVCDSLISAGSSAPWEMTKEFLDDMNEEVDRLTAIINDLLDLTRMDSESYGTKTFVTANLRDVIRGVVESLKKIASQSGVVLSFESHYDVFMLMEQNKIWEAIYNITDNAIKYTPYGGKVSLFLERNNTETIITVKDSGIGIAKEDINKIFDRFYRVDKARSRETGGTGLGLAIALSAVEMHGGHIDVESEEGAGSTFRIYLPTV